MTILFTIACLNADTPSPSNTIASLFLIYMDTLMSQIEDIVRKEKRNQAWVPISRQQHKWEQQK